MSVDSYRFLDFASRQVMKAWAARQEPDVIPFTPMTKPLAECTVALVSTAGIARNDDVPFDQERERRDPWWGDPSFRVIPLRTTERDVRLYHSHIDPRFGEADLDVVRAHSERRVRSMTEDRTWKPRTSFYAAERTRGDRSPAENAGASAPSLDSGRVCCVSRRYRKCSRRVLWRSPLVEFWHPSCTSR